MPGAEKKKLVAGLLAEELDPHHLGGSDLKTLAKQVYQAYLKNLIMTKKKARSILTGKTSCTSVRSLLCKYTLSVNIWNTFSFRYRLTR
jgi:uncharacterized protein YfbU (UPF0304 family)